MIMRESLLFILVWILGHTSHAIVVLQTPLMGWSTWESFGKHLTEDKIIANLAILTRSGLKAKGYTMVQVDDGWMRMNRTTGWISRYGQLSKPVTQTSKKKGAKVIFPPGKQVGCMMPDSIKFPKGMKTFGERIKAMGFKFGLYTSGEDTVCDSNPKFKGLYASSQYYNLRAIDAECFIQWGVDLMKIDMCNPPTRSVQLASSVMRAWRKLLPKNVVIYNSRYGCLAPVRCGQPALGGNPYSCPMSIDFAKNRRIETYCHETAHIARASADIKPRWSSIIAGMLSIVGRGKVSRPGFWSDPDYLVPHHSLLSFKETRSQFSAWCIMSAPLLISADLTKASEATLNMLGNPSAIRVNQKYYNSAGDLLRFQGVLYVFRKQLSATEFAVLVLHAGRPYARGSGPLTDANVPWSPKSLKSIIPSGITLNAQGGLHRCKMQNIWNPGGQQRYIYSNTTFTIEARDCVFLILSDCRL